jgi:hypothetical protein
LRRRGLEFHRWTGPCWSVHQVLAEGTSLAHLNAVAAFPVLGTLRIHGFAPIDSGGGWSVVPVHLTIDVRGYSHRRSSHACFNLTRDDVDANEEQQAGGQLSRVHRHTRWSRTEYTPSPTKYLSHLIFYVNFNHLFY